MQDGNTEWPALASLAGLDDRSQRHFLRPSSAELRKLDQELDRIELRELRAQSVPSSSEKYHDIPPLKKLLRESAAFVQYLNTHLYFGVRFAAGRISFPYPRASLLTRLATRNVSDCNEAIIGLPSPPLCKDGFFDPSDVETFINQVVRGDEADPLIPKALQFLDDGGDEQPSAAQSGKRDEHSKFELWLRGLYFDQAKVEGLTNLANGLLRWARSRYNFYTNLESKGEKESWVRDWQRATWAEGRWNVNNPLAARCAISDFYWLARILRADVSPRGLVTYLDRSWLEYLAMKPAGPDNLFLEFKKEDILRWEEVLRSVFGYACDLIQNAVEIVEDCEDRAKNPGEYATLPKDTLTTQSWRRVYDQELEEIRGQRQRRGIDSGPSTKGHRGKECIEDENTKGWSRRIWTGEDVDNLVGIALSGGGIRSATFNLGVLQCLQDLDLLRQVDYLSTVSGGGYVGAWLLGNVRRSRYWLSKTTSWDRSIQHLRKYSNYLAPHNGLLSADTWSMWATWVRNAVLIQLNAFVWMSLLLVTVLFLQPVFLSIGRPEKNWKFLAQFVFILGVPAVGAIVSFYLWQLSRSRAEASKRLDAFLGKVKQSKLRDLLHSVSRWAVSKGDSLPWVAASIAWVGSFVSAGVIWNKATTLMPGSTYYQILMNSYDMWSVAVNVIFLLSLWLIVFSSFEGVKRRTLWSPIVAVVGWGLSYFILCGLIRVFLEFLSRSTGSYAHLGEWFAYVFGPALTMGAFTSAIVVLIGLIGRDAPDWTREWWTRYGALLGMIGAGTLLLALAAVFGPLWLYKLFHLSWKSVKIGAVLSWLGTVTAGLFSGNSGRTGGAEKSSPLLEWIAWLGGLLFVVGAVLVSATTVFVVLGNALPTDFDPAQHWKGLADIVESAGWPLLLGIPFGIFVIGFVFSDRFDLNTFGLNQFYRNRLVRCYLGATRWQPGKRHPHLFTGFDDADDVKLSDLKRLVPGFCHEEYRGPFPVINCALNLGGSSDLTVHSRQSASFTLTPLYSGAMRKRMGYTPTEGFYGGELTLGQAISISGAAASPNMGYSTSPLVSVLLTLFNVRLGWWFPNPAGSMWNKTGPLSRWGLIPEMFGLADEKKNFVNVSDGGHFENLGIYELIRRRARVIIAGDAECDSQLTFGSLGNVVRICDTDFGAKIDIDVSSIRRQAQSETSHAHCAVGKIYYSNGTLGYLIYIKSSLTGDEDVGVAQYSSTHPTFPHESTADQFFSEDRFEAYRRLGEHVTERTFRHAKDETSDPYATAVKLFDLWVPASVNSEAFITNAKAFDTIWDHFRTDTHLLALLHELTDNAQTSPVPPVGSLAAEELVACMQLMQLMENVFLDLRLDEFWDHPDNRGWAMLFTMYAKSAKFRAAWGKIGHTYGIRFAYFCEQYLGLEHERPIRRV